MLQGSGERRGPEGDVLQAGVGVPGGGFCAGQVAGVVGEGDAKRVREALPRGVPRPPGMADVSSLDTKESIMREYGALAYVPREVYGNAVRGAHVLRTIRQVGVENMERTTVRDCLVGACGAGMDLSLLSTLVGTHGANVDAVHRWGKTALMLPPGMATRTL